MNRIILIILFVMFSQSVYATSPEESRLLQSWGVTQNEDGDVTYLNINQNSTRHWASTPIPSGQNIDYSVLPNTVKPLVIYR